MCQAKAMAAVYEANRSICKYVHSTSRGHEALQLAAAYNLLPCDYVSPYYRDESMMLGMGFSPSKWLQAGDMVRIEIDGIGAIENRFEYLE